MKRRDAQIWLGGGLTAAFDIDNMPIRLDRAGVAKSKFARGPASIVCASVVLMVRTMLSAMSLRALCSAEGTTLRRSSSKALKRISTRSREPSDWMELHWRPRQAVVLARGHQ